MVVVEYFPTEAHILWGLSTEEASGDLCISLGMQEVLQGREIRYSLLTPKICRDSK